MHVTDLEINRILGIVLAPPGVAHVVELVESGNNLNHLGSIHATAQFALAEAASGEFLLGALGERQEFITAVLRRVDVKFSRAARGRLRAWAEFARMHGESTAPDTLQGRRTLVWVLVHVRDDAESLVMRAEYHWVLTAN